MFSTYMKHGLLRNVLDRIDFSEYVSDFCWSSLAKSETQAKRIRRRNLPLPLPTGCSKLPPQLLWRSFLITVPCQEDLQETVFSPFLLCSALQDSPLNLTITTRLPPQNLLPFSSPSWHIIHLMLISHNKIVFNTDKLEGYFSICHRLGKFKDGSTLSGTNMTF